MVRVLLFWCFGMLGLRSSQSVFEAFGFLTLLRITQIALLRNELSALKGIIGIIWEQFYVGKKNAVSGLSVNIE